MLMIKKLWDEKPLTLILFSAGFFRLLAVLFSKGFGMHDDHFLVIEMAQSWVDHSYYNWLPFGDSPIRTATGHSLFYTGLNFLMLKAMAMMGLTDPQLKMYFIRFVHAAFSLLVVYYGFKITEFYSGAKVARIAGLLLAILWFMPMLSVRNLVEMVCIPFLMAPVWLIIKNGEMKKKSIYLLAGLVAGTAFSIRFQSSLFITGIGLTLVVEKNWRAVIAYGAGTVVSVLLIQGSIDMFLWGKPFAEFMGYVKFNREHAYDFVTHGAETYPLLISGILLPPISLFLWFGYFRNWRKQLIIFLPSFLFFVFHTSFPNKQERFILPFIPFFIMLGCIGWQEFVSGSAFWIKRPKLLRNCWIFFWALNILPLCVVSVAYSKRNRVESMTYLYHKKDAGILIIDDANNDDIILPPLFYLRPLRDKWGVIPVTKSQSPRKVRDILKTADKKYFPNYVIFWGEDNIETRVDSMKKYFPQLQYETTIEPGLVDRIVHYLNPINQNQTTYIYKL